MCFRVNVFRNNKGLLQLTDYMLKLILDLLLSLHVLVRPLVGVWQQHSLWIAVQDASWFSPRRYLLIII